MADRKKVLKAAVIAAIIVVPAAAAAWYYWPKDIFIYIIAEHDPVAFQVRLDGEAAIDGDWKGTAVNISPASIVHFSKETVAGTGFEMGISVNGTERSRAHYSVFEGNYFWIYLYDELAVIQSKTEPPEFLQLRGG